MANDTLVESYENEVKYALDDLEQTLQGDRYALRDAAHLSLRGLLYALGRVLLYRPDYPLPELETQLILTGARHAGTFVLNYVGDDQKRAIAAALADIRSRDGTEQFEGEDRACGFIEDLMAHTYVTRALKAYRDAVPEDDEGSDREQLDRAVKEFETIAKVYHDGLVSNPDGIRALTWVNKNTNLVKNLRAMWPEGEEVPWFLRADWYANHGIP